MVCTVLFVSNRNKVEIEVVIYIVVGVVTFFLTCDLVYLETRHIIIRLQL